MKVGADIYSMSMRSAYETGSVNEKIYITVTCTSCGAKNQVIKGRLSNCEYCGQRLNS